MAELMKSYNGVLFWDVSFFRGVHAWELEAMSGFMETIYGSSIRGFGEDKMCWPYYLRFSLEKYLEAEDSV